jgi:hypothetical protein
MGRRSVLVVACLTLLFHAAGFSQPTIINKTALIQTRLIETKKNIGTAFVIEVDHREYWITAKHIFSGIENAPPGVFTTKTVQANVLFPFAKVDAGAGKDQLWKTITFTTIDPGKDIDILVLVPEHTFAKFLPPDSMKPASDTDPAAENALVPIGGDCEFLGYPYGGGWKATTPIYSIKGELKSPAPAGWFWSPFAKHCTLSGSILQNGITVLVLDGIDNLGFSGGPVVTGKRSSLQVFAVISSYHAEPLEVLPAPDHVQAYISPVPPPLPGQRSSPKQVVESNSGLILAYDITPAIKAIHANPIGPLLLESSENIK